MSGAVPEIGGLGRAPQAAALGCPMDGFCWQGAKFPWESAATGREVCPEEIYGAQEIHVTGDVLMAFEQYYHTTQVKVVATPMAWTAGHLGVVTVSSQRNSAAVCSHQNCW